MISGTKHEQSFGLKGKPVPNSRPSRLWITILIRRWIPGLLLVVTAHGQSPTVEMVKDSLLARFNRIEDYTVNVKISVDMTGLRMPRKKIKLYYKAPDKIKVEADGFAIVPKTGLGGSPMQFLRMMDSVYVIGRETVGQRDHWKLSGTVIPDSLKLPVSDSDDLPGIDMFTWVDVEWWVISRVETMLDNQKVFTVENEFMEIDHLHLPQETLVRIGFKGLKDWSLRDPMGGPAVDRKDFGEIVEEAGNEQEEKEFAGTVTMDFSGYKINRGLEDKVFEESGSSK